MTEKCAHRYVQPVFNPETGEGYARCADCGETVEGIEVTSLADAPKEVQDAVAAMQEAESIDIPAFTPEDTKAIATLPLGLIKPVVTGAQFAALTKFVSINQMVTGLNEKGEPRYDA